MRTNKEEEELKRTKADIELDRFRWKSWRGNKKEETKYEHQPIRSSFPSPTATEEEPGGIVSDDPNCWMEEEQKRQDYIQILLWEEEKVYPWEE